MNKLLFLLLVSFSLLLGANTSANKNAGNKKQEAIQIMAENEAQRIAKEDEEKRRELLSSYVKQLVAIESKILEEKVWMKSYASYLTSLDVRNSLEDIQSRIQSLKRKRKKTIAQRDELNSLVSKQRLLSSQVEKLKKEGTAPFSRLLTPQKIDEETKISNPFDILTGLSLIDSMEASYEDYINKKAKLLILIDSLKEEAKIYETITPLDIDSEYLEEQTKKLKQLDRFEEALDTMVITADLYKKRLEVREVNINKQIEVQSIKLGKIGLTIIFVIIIFTLLKLVVKKYITDNERFYMANKIITFINFTVIVLVVFFSYLENASYLVTILGFASAGIAIAMKDWFMSILGWLVIVFGGSIHVGDRIRVDMDGMKYVGDVMDISLLRMTILEDITLTTIYDNRRAGRIMFVPNNYIFTRMIANYTHSSLKTVWDGVAVTITYDSNHKKAMHIAKEVTKKFSKGYTDITRKQLNKLRNQYSLKNTNVEPRIFSFIKDNGISIDSWYLTNAYATLTLRSVISLEIVDAFNAEDDITIAYPTQMLHMEDSIKTKKPPFATGDEVVNV